MKNCYVVRGIDKDFPHGCWKLDLLKKIFIIDTDFLVYMKTTRGMSPEMVAHLIREVESAQYQKWLDNKKVEMKK